MQGGDISSEPASRIVIVFEGTLAGLDPADHAKRDHALRRTLMHRPEWKKAAGMWQLDRHGLGFVSYVTYNHNFPVDVLSFLDQREWDCITDILDNTMGLPFANYYRYDDREDAARSLALFPHIRAIYDFEHPAYGFKSRTSWELS